MALRGGAEPRPEWLAALHACAGAPVTVLPATELAIACTSAVGDVVVVTEEVAVADGWLAVLARRPAGVGVGTASAVAIPEGEADALRRASSGLGRPFVADHVTGPCVLLAAEALALVGTDGLDPADPSAFVTAFAERCAAHGLVNLVADGAVVGGVSAEAEEGTPAGHAQAWARSRALGPSITIDARSLVSAGAGTQVHTLELIRALAARERLRLRVVLPPENDADPGALRELRAMANLELKTYADVVNSGIETDIVHRPYQVFTVHDLRLLRRLGRRIIVTQQDQLLYRNQSYFGSREEWEDYRQVCRIALAWADRTVFFTEHARNEALRDELLDEGQAVVVGIGVDRAQADAAQARKPDGLAAVGDVPFLLCLGTDLAHKNRPFAIRLLQALRAAQGWEGALVLAGSASPHGSSRAEEQRLIAQGDAPVIVLDQVDEAERLWLFEHCSAVVFPSIEEGFGLPPFEAGAAGKPCLFAPLGAMAETLPADAARLVPWDAEASAAQSLELLSPGPDRERHVALLREAGTRFRWSATAERMEQLYDEVLASAARPVAPIVATEIEHQAEYEAFRSRTGEDGMALLGPGGYLPAEMLRPLLAVTSRPALRRPLFALLRLLYRAGHRSGR